MAWQGLLLTGFDRRIGEALDLFESSHATFMEAITACYPELHFCELSRLFANLKRARPELAQELTANLFAAYGLRWCERLSDTVNAILQTPVAFQKSVDEKKWGTRDLAPLLALKSPGEITPFLTALSEMPLGKSQAVQALEWVIELYLLGRPLNDLMPADHDGDAYMRRLKQWRKPVSVNSDEQWTRTVGQWPWPAHVQGRWQRFGDQAGLEIKIQTTSPQDFHKKLERLISIRDAWSCND